MNFREILEADIALYEQKQGEFLSETIPDESVKTNINPKRSQLIGEIMIIHFPDLECFQPQLNKAANKKEFQLFEDFLTAISSDKTFKKELKKMVESKRTECETKKIKSTKRRTTCKSALLEPLKNGSFENEKGKE